MERSFQDLDLTQIKVGAESRFPPEGGEAAANGAADDTTTDTATESETVTPAEPAPTARPAYSTIREDGEEDTNPSHHLEEGVLKVSSHSRHSAVAGAIAGVLRHDSRAEVQAIGAAACYQAIKAVATARSYLLPEGIDLSCVPLFTDVTIGEHERTAIRFIVTRHMVEQTNQ